MEAPEESSNNIGTSGRNSFQLVSDVERMAWLKRKVTYRSVKMACGHHKFPYLSGTLTLSNNCVPETCVLFHKTNTIVVYSPYSPS